MIILSITNTYIIYLPVYIFIYNILVLNIVKIKILIINLYCVLSNSLDIKITTN